MQLQGVAMKTFPVFGYQLLRDRGNAGNLAFAGDVLKRWRIRPCTFDGFFYDHARSFPKPEALLSLESTSILEARADKIEVDNVLTEANNANIRRDCARVVQQKRMCLDEIVSVDHPQRGRVREHNVV